MIEMGFSLPIKGIRVLARDVMVELNYKKIVYDPFKKKVSLHGLDGWDLVINHVDRFSVNIIGNKFQYGDKEFEVIMCHNKTLQQELDYIKFLINGSEGDGELCPA